MFTRQIAKFIASERLLSHDARVLVALSGGADSVALFCVLKQLGYALSAVHCNFHLRGAESDRDETFVRDLCRKEHVPLEVVHFDTIAYAARHKMSIEMAARELRYEAFETLRREQEAEAIAVAHHRDDSVETLLLNLIRGTGINGLKGIRPRNGYVIRPLLAVSRQDIADYLERIGQAYVTDSTNLHDDYTRNKVRLNILPLMEQINPSVKDSLTETAARLNEVAILYNKVMKAETQCISTHLPDGTLHIDQTKWQASDTPKSLLYELLSPYGFRPAQIDDICLSARHTPGRRFRSATHEVLSDRGCWLLYRLDTPENVSFEINTQDGYRTLPGDARQLAWDTIDITRFELSRSKAVACLDAGKLSFPLTVRHAAQGDKFIPFGMKGKKLLSDYMTDRKFSLRQKELQWVVCCGEQIVWVVGERIDERYRVTEQTRTVLRMTIKDDSPLPACVSEKS